MAGRILKVLATGQHDCFNELGRKVVCSGTGQDGEWQAGITSPTPRFEVEGEVVWDCLTGLCWTRDASPAEFPLMWQEALDFVAGMNKGRAMGYVDWRLPSRAELLSLLCFQQTRPPLPRGHSFINIFPGWYWSSTTAAYQPAHAWYLDMDGGRLFYGGKEQSFMVWPVRGDSRLIWRRQSACFNSSGVSIECHGSGQDGAGVMPAVFPQPRFSVQGEVMTDQWSGLEWTVCADLAGGLASWKEALELVRDLGGEPARPWRLPNINELESLVDYDHARPALTPDIPLMALQPAYWSSTTSIYEPDWAWALYLEKGAIGVGQKKGRHFHVIAVR